MTAHMKREIEKLKARLLEVSAAAEKNLCLAVESLREKDSGLAKKVIDGDIEIDHMEVDVEEECLKILALHQPVAVDLRFVITALKINNDLERIGDLAVNIAERSEFLARQREIDIPQEIYAMAEKAQSMLTRSLDALVDMDCKLAHDVCADDDEVDAINRQMYLIVQDKIRAHTGQTEVLIHLLSASRHLERIADYATNIAEDVIYMVEGKIVRHRTEKYK